ncbi:MAG: U32 family peptidase, partial [Bacteroidales bacterium]|nr:U32 family peptidase [Bacteroidales bacterium]
VHLLSLKDLALGAYVADMAARGIVSFKIEGRLKDVCYVRNVTAHYRRVLDKVLAGEVAAQVTGAADGLAGPSVSGLSAGPGGYRRASCGRVYLTFEPDLNKGFHRPYGTHFIDPAVRGEKASIHTPKAMGEPIGRVRTGKGRRWLVDTAATLLPGDGLCFFDGRRQLVGFGLNAVQPGDTAGACWVVAAKDVPLSAGTALFRNQDVAFEKALRAERAAVRRVAVAGGFAYRDGQARLWARDEEGLEVVCTWQADYAAADHPDRMRENFLKQIRKTGDLPFEWVDFELETPPFIPIAELNARRRELLSALYGKRVAAHAARPQAVAPVVPTPLSAPPTDENGRPLAELDYRANVANAWAEAFYRRRGVEHVARERRPGQWLMQCKYCIRYELRQCPRHFKSVDPDYQQDLYLVYKGHTFALHFDCAHERMEVCALQNGREA